jgi:hypothetical protein
MLSAVAILIERTKTHPEEFANGYSSDYGKWDDVIKEFCLCMTAEEKDALTAAMTEAKRTMFNEAVMKRLASSDKKNDLLEEIAIRSNKPKSLMTISQITSESLKILEQQLTTKGIKYATEYDVATDSYTLAQQRKK